MALEAGLYRRRGGFVRAFALVLLLTTAACEAPIELVGGPTPTESAAADTLATLLDGVDDTAFREAFSALRDFEYVRYTRTEQFDSDDFLVAYREHVLRSSPGATARHVDIQASDSAGTFEFGFFNRFVSRNLRELDPVNLVPYLLTDQPDYLRPRNREKYEWRYLPDTLLWDMQAQVIELRARPLLGDGENIRRVRHYVDRTTNELVAMYLERIDLALLFREESYFYMHMRRAPDGRLVPYNTRFHTNIRTPFRTDHQFRTVSTYYDVRPARAHSTAAETPTDGGPLASE